MNTAESLLGRSIEQTDSMTELFKEARDIANQALDQRDALSAELARVREALKTIDDAFWTDGESLADQIADLKNIARAALASTAKKEET